MTRRIIPFPSPGQRGPKGRPSGMPGFLPSQWGEVVFVTFFYLGIAVSAWILPLRQFDVLFGLVMLYWAFVHQQVHRTGFFAKNWPLLFFLAILLAIVHWQTAVGLAVVALLYILLIARRHPGPSSFARYHLLSALMGAMLLAWSVMVLFSASQLVLAIWRLAGPVAGVEVIATGIEWLVLSYRVIVGIMAIALAIFALSKKTPALPFVTRQILYWV